ncbi:hypothetical protein [Colwellia echini]|uniref:Uncharacterized protein n=1 Tax=Colwellia echini TaxID=1982103 RepID=A0ABY3MXS7_9GAMM|nr:hypothetical protein [Colwellia echini]TYK66013.1 hypothetical protein CWS31_006995 [Colwellia echini]
MTDKNIEIALNLDTSNLGFNLSPRVKELLEADVIPESELLIAMFMAPVIEPKALLSFVTLEINDIAWQISALEVYEVQGSNKDVERLGYIELVHAGWDELKEGLSRDKLIQQWQDDIIYQLDKHGKLIPSSYFTQEHLELIKQANVCYATQLEEQLLELVRQN